MMIVPTDNGPWLPRWDLTLVIEAVILTAMKGWTTPVVATGTETTVRETGNIAGGCGDVLSSTYLFPFEVASLILLVAMMGPKDIGGRCRRNL